MPPRAVIFGCAGPRLSDQESAFFRDTDPLGFILFQRNCESKDQLSALVDALRQTVGRADAPVLIDQEGGRVARMKPPEWPESPAAAQFGALSRIDPESGHDAAWLNGRLLADMVGRHGINVDCVPVLDLPQPGASQAIGDRAFDDDPRRAAELGRATCDGLLAGGVLPVIKHVPGHGRATVDSHDGLPEVDADFDTLARHDFVPFRALNDMPLAMTAHIRFTAIDPAHPATLSPRVINDVIRGEIGIDGLLMTDDLGMNALSGTLGERAAAAIDAGCDVVLHCNGDGAEMADVAAATGPMTDAAAVRWDRARDMLTPPEPFDPVAGRDRLRDLLAAGASA